MVYTPPIQLTDRLYEEAFLHQGETVLRCACALPRLHGLSRRAEARINRYYRRMEQTVRRACRTALFSRASRLAEAARGESLPFAPLDASLTWETTCRTGSLWSLLWQWQVTTEGEPLAFRQQGEVWSLRTGLPCPLSRFDPPGRHRARILSRLRREARGAGVPGPGRHLSFALTEEGLRCLWPTCHHPALPGDYRSVILPCSDPKHLKF